MAAWNYSNTAAETTLSGSIGAPDASIVVLSATGLPVTFPYSLVLDYLQPTAEIVTVNSAVGTTLAVTRGQDGTAAQAHTAGARVVHAVVARDLREASLHGAATTDVHGIGVGAAVVGTTTAQTLSGKTINGGSNTIQNVPASQVNGTFKNLKTEANVAGDVAMTVDAAVGQTADLQQWRDSADVPVMKINAAGEPVLPAQVRANVATNINANTTITGTLAATGAVTAQAGATVTGTATATTVASTGATNVGGNLAVTGTSNLAGAVTANGGVTSSGAITGGTVAATGNATVGGTLGVTGTTTAQQIDVSRAAGANPVIRAKTNADTSWRTQLRADGVLDFGPGGVGAFDTNLYRGAADQLKTDDNLMIKEHLALRGESGAQLFSFTAQTSDFADIVFATPFPTAPIVVATVASNAGNTSGWTARVASITTTGFRLTVSGTSNTWAGIPVNWIAVL